MSLQHFQHILIHKIYRSFSKDFYSKNLGHEAKKSLLIWIKDKSEIEFENDSYEPKLDSFVEFVAYDLCLSFVKTSSLICNYKLHVLYIFFSNQLGFHSIQKKLGIFVIS